LERVENAVEKSRERNELEDCGGLTNYKVRDEMIEILSRPTITIWFNVQDLGRPDRYPSPEIDRILELAVSDVGAFECAVVGEYGYRGTNMHLKLVCVDDIVILGSMNFSYFFR
jgi:phosphatidylserine/phosphatidylglycerophosphate/cardiolipin synthase-like enzyme